jgi:hypothetical protein
MHTDAETSAATKSSVQSEQSTLLAVNTEHLHFTTKTKLHMEAGGGGGGNLRPSATTLHTSHLTLLSSHFTLHTSHLVTSQTIASLVFLTSNA